jgi:diguanylate cyclase (GGDEF)-like protein
MDIVAAVPAGALAAALTVTTQYACRLRRRVYHDPATGLANRDALARRVRQVRRYATQIGLLLMDLDDFKHINDRHGHQIGNQVIREVADRLRATALPGELAVRLHGDEFVLLLGAVPSGKAGRRAARLRADAVAAAITDPITTPRGQITVTGSVGAAALPVAAADLSGLLTVADDAMYRAKHLRTDRSRRTASAA